MIDRPHPMRRIAESFEVHPAVALTGPRQCGKTTLARRICGSDPSCHYFDLELPADAARMDVPIQTLGDLRGLVVIDEIQRRPDLFEVLRVLIDRPDAKARFLLLGSASPGLVRGVSESLAGRAGLVPLGGFDLNEVGTAHWRRLWVRGGFPRSFLAPSDRTSAVWRDSFVQTFLERDIPQLGITTPAHTLRRFWTMLAHYHGQIWNAAEFARALGTTERTAKRYLDILAGTFMLRVLQPWFENLKKRQVKSPRVYLRDSGLLHSLVGLTGFAEINGHPKCGASFEGFAVEQIINAFGSRHPCFWRTHAGAELDLLVHHKGKRLGFEFKWTDAPKVTPSMRIALADLSLDRLYIVCPGNETYALDTKITVMGVRHIPELSRALGSDADERRFGPDGRPK